MKKNWQKYMMYFALAVLVAGIIFSLVVILGGIKSSFEMTQRSEDVGAMIRLEEIG